MKTPETPDNRRLRIENIAPMLVLAVSLAFTYLLWQNAHLSSIQEQRSEFDSRVSDIRDRINRRIESYEQMLHGVRAFYLNQREMERHEFAGYLATMELEKNSPGIQGFSFAPLISAGGRLAHINEMSRSGLPGYSIRPEGARAHYAPVAFIEPMNERNARVLGFDNLSNPIRKATIERARDEDRALISEKLVLKQEDERAVQAAGVLMFLPVFRRGSTHDTPSSRQANIAGWFAAAFRIDQLMTGVLDERSRGLGIEIFDDGEISGQTGMYSSAGQSGYRTPPRYVTVSAMQVAGRKWALRISSRPEFEAQRHLSAERDTALAGVLLSFLLTLITWLVVRDRQRTTQMASAVGHELAMRKQAEHKTHDLYMFNKAILESSPAGIAVYQENGSCVMANEAFARAIGGTVDDVLKQDFRINASWKRNGLLAYADQALSGGTTVRHDIEGETSFGKKVVMECIFAPVTIADRPHLLLMVSDVSERTQAKRALTESMHQLEAKEMAKTRFLAAAGHDLRQPLAAANLFIDALKLTDQTPRQHEIIQRLDQSMATFNGLLDALLNISKLDAGMIKPEHAAIDVAELFNWLDQNFAPMADEKHLGLRLHFPTREILVVRSDISLLKSVLMNLVANAVKFTRKGAILISARRRGDAVLFQVWDSGIGIDDQHIAHIFDEFYQIDNPQRDRSSGLGLGLSIVKRALTLLGATINCRSRPGRGSVFEFCLPLESAPQQGTPGPTVSDEVNAAFARDRRFVVVEDDALVAQAMINWLESMGGEVRCFHNAEDALRHPNIDHADYYIADYMLGGTHNGIQFLNEVRRRLGRPIKAALVTGDTSAAFIRQAADCDWPVLHKPINTSRLATCLSA